ncbi:nodulation protein NfeD [Candidatus Sumerlaeota bacterium]|nr:nodulation protein NfeD [Candidatus Sumerlaeota bacterium]
MNVFKMIFAVLLFVFVSCQHNNCVADPISPTPMINRIRLQDVSINPLISQFIAQSIEESEKDGVPLLIELDTPGGLLRSTRDIVKSILASRVPIIVYIAPNGARAASAGVFITLSAHVAAMAPASNIGAAHPVDVKGSWPEVPKDFEERVSTQTVDLLRMKNAVKDVMSEKIMNDTLAWVKGIAELRGRNADWARTAVEKSESLVAANALKLNVIDFVSSSTGDLLGQIEGRTIVMNTGTTTVLHTKGAVIRDLEMSRTQNWLNMVVDPSMAYILFLFGIGMLMYEVTHFGMLIPGIIGMICLLMSAFAFQILPINYASLALLLLGIGLIIAEIKFTSYGLLTVLGAVCLWFGASGLVDTAPGFPGIAKGLIATVTFSIVAVMLLLVYLLIRAFRRRVFIGQEAMEGKSVKVMEPLEPSGRVEWDGTYWNAMCEDGPAAVGDVVYIARVDGLLLYVTKTKPEESKTK